jgi:ComF family protein
LQEPVVIDRIIAPLAYRYPVMELIKNIKYNHRVMLIPGMASVLVTRLLRRTDDLPQVMVPVPLSYYRWLSRGFNQAIEICKFLHSQLQIPYDADLVRRVKNTPPLFPLSPEERARQLRGAFAVATTVTCRSVAIVDDVVTTGSTVNEIARILHARGVEHIEVWALARTC